jgi:hypothetical protein
MVGKPKGRRPLGRRVYNIIIDLGGIKWGGVDWIGLAQDK